MRSLHLLFLDWHHLNWKPLITIITKIVIGLRHCISNLLWHCHLLSCLQLFQSCFPPPFSTLTSVLLSYALRPSLLLSQVNLRLIKKVTPMTLTTWQFTSWYYVNAQHLSFSTTLHFVAQPLSSFSILGCHHQMKELLIIKEPLSLIVTVSTSCSLICSPTTPLALSPSVPLSCALSCSILPPLTWFLTQSRKKIRNVPQLIFFQFMYFKLRFH